jgi:hypothetical protein
MAVELTVGKLLQLKGTDNIFEIKAIGDKTISIVNVAKPEKTLIVPKHFMVKWLDIGTWVEVIM